ncbi:MAG: cyclic nucleotide-binding domain-containing protein [bacterium]|nr:cyclic nucleotide-binding domain-containing protein [bacterium]
MFSELSGKDRMLIALIATEEQLPPDSLLCEEGDIGDELFLVIEGKISVERIDTEGSLKQLAIIGENSCVGETSLFVDQPRNATLRVIETSKILFIQKILLHELIKDYPQIAFGIISSLIYRQ